MLPASSSNTSTQPIRPEMVANAVSFMTHENVRDTPIARKVAFLEHKGLTSQEIREALNQANGESPSRPASIRPPPRRRRDRHYVEDDYEDEDEFDDNSGRPSALLRLAPPSASAVGRLPGRDRPVYQIPPAPTPAVASSPLWKTILLSSILTVGIGGAVAYLVQRYLPSCIPFKSKDSDISRLDDATTIARGARGTIADGNTGDKVGVDNKPLIPETNTMLKASEKASREISELRDEVTLLVKVMQTQSNEFKNIRTKLKEMEAKQNETELRLLKEKKKRKDKKKEEKKMGVPSDLSLVLGELKEALNNNSPAAHNRTTPPTSAPSSPFKGGAGSSSFNSNSNINRKNTTTTTTTTTNSNKDGAVDFPLTKRFTTPPSISNMYREAASPISVPSQLSSTSTQLSSSHQLDQDRNDATVSSHPTSSPTHLSSPSPTTTTTSSSISSGASAVPQFDRIDAGASPASSTPTTPLSNAPRSGADQGSYPASFNEIVSMVQSGQTPPDVRTDIDDSPLDPQASIQTNGATPSPAKPWERRRAQRIRNASQRQRAVDDLSVPDPLSPSPADSAPSPTKPFPIAHNPLILNNTSTLTTTSTTSSPPSSDGGPASNERALAATVLA
eukprot:TRINITY_DN1847_c0_g1_i1.p1 TRINITY_DN1847_c0_g1~~TRINITY_DN1847_c0_g1_i1.p1  ORF type:complete len:619 (+),score=141.90 TRINITY_DN1847_c0_g1_i1:1009-2865(+)